MKKKRKKKLIKGKDFNYWGVWNPPKDCQHVEGYMHLAVFSKKPVDCGARKPVRVKLTILDN